MEHIDSENDYFYVFLGSFGNDFSSILRLSPLDFGYMCKNFENNF